MTELEKIERAKMYMDKLANGINPLTDIVIPDTDLVNNVRLSRCFFFVSDVLRQVIENGGTVGKRQSSREHRLPFSLSEEQRKSIVFPDVPITITSVAKQINTVIDTDKITPLKYSSVTGWLLSEGLLYVAHVNNKSPKLPTPEGNKIGIFTEDRIGQNGSYTAVLYNKDAQQFILDNIDSIMKMEKSITDMNGQPWSPDDDQHLRDLYKNGISVPEMSVSLHRNVSSIHSRLKKLGIAKS